MYRWLVGVVPAHAGLYRGYTECEDDPDSSPRTRGVVSLNYIHYVDGVDVVPAHAGLYLTKPCLIMTKPGSPRTRGVVSVPDARDKFLAQ